MTFGAGLRESSEEWDGAELELQERVPGQGHGLRGGSSPAKLPSSREGGLGLSPPPLSLLVFLNSANTSH